MNDVNNRDERIGTGNLPDPGRSQGISQAVHHQLPDLHGRGDRRARPGLELAALALIRDPA